MTRAGTRERLVLAPEERRDAVLSVIRSARERLVLSLFRCDDFRILDALAEALRRSVQVDVLLTGRAKGGRKRLQALWAFLESMGARVCRYAEPVVKYHAKYIVADEGPALVASLNFTRKCFERTCDFLVITYDPDVAGGLKKLFDLDCCAPGGALPRELSERLIIGPERARRQLTSLIKNARRSIQIIDHKVTDPAIAGLLRAKHAAGVSVEVLGRGTTGRLRSHGKMLRVDSSVAVVGSIALASLSLDFRREVALLTRDRRLVQALGTFFAKQLATRAGRAGARAFAQELAS